MLCLSIQFDIFLVWNIDNDLQNTYWYFWGSLIAMVTKYKVTFKKSLSVAKLMTIFCSALSPKN